MSRKCNLYFINTLRPIQNDGHFLGNNFTCNLLNENVWITINISLKFVPKCQIQTIPALVQIMAWCRTGHKPLPEAVMTWFTGTRRQISNIRPTYTPNFNVSRLVLQFRFPSYWCQALSRVWRCSWSSAERRCSNSNYIWLINNIIAH